MKPSLTLDLSSSLVISPRFFKSLYAHFATDAALVPLPRGIAHIAALADPWG